MRRGRDRAIEVKTPAQLAVMREAGLIVAAALRAAAAAVEPGISTAELDAIAEREIRGAGAVPSFKGYYGFPATICTSVNDQVVHGIPSPVAAELTGLLDACEEALWHGLARAVPGARLTDISAAVEAAARARGPFGIVEDYTGHGIGTQMHMDPPVPNYGMPGRGPVLTEGMALAVEPMLVLGQPDTRSLPDGWTVVTADGTWAAHFEHTVAITADGPWVLTAADGGAAGLARVRDGHAPAPSPTPSVPAGARGSAGGS
jgi:methionyl aminopeptidase